MRILIKNGRIIDPANNIDKQSNIYIAEGKILAVDNYLDSFNADQEIDASNQLVCPGLVDLSVRMREPGFEHKGTIESESKAAAAAGVTSLAYPPDTDPVIDTPAMVKLIRRRTELHGMTKAYCLGAMTQDLEGRHLSNMGALKKAGCVGVSNALTPIKNPQVMKRIMEYAATFDLTVYLFPEDPSLRHEGCMHEGAISTRLGLPGIPEAAETVNVARDLALIQDTGVRAHFCRISSAKATKMIARAQFEGLAVTMDASAHQLYLTDMDVGEFDSQCHVRPPLRGQRDKQGLRQAVLTNNISAICSDHQPHEADAKLRPFNETEPGISALETLLPLTLRLTEESPLSLSDAIQRITVGPAKILGIGAGTLSPGAAADVIIIDPEEYWKVGADTFTSEGKNTPFKDWDMKGRVRHTLLNGELIYSAK